MERFNSAASKSPSPIPDESDSSMPDGDEDYEPPWENKDDDDVAQSHSHSTDDSDSSMSEGDNDDSDPSMTKDKDGLRRPKSATIGDATPDYPVEVCMLASNPKKPVLLFKFTDVNNTLKCYKFYIEKYRCRNMSFLATCTGCVSIRNRLVKGSSPTERYTIHLSSIKTDGSRMFTDPHSVHAPGCVPFDYDDIIKKYHAVTPEVKEKVIKGQDISRHLYPHGCPFSANKVPNYPVEVCMSVIYPKNPIFLYKFKDNSKEVKCYKFITTNSIQQDHHHSNMNFSTICAGCKSIYNKAKRQNSESAVHRTIRTTDCSRMFSDPHTNHLPGCVPFDYGDVIEKNPLVTDEVKERIIKGEVVQYLYPLGSPFIEPLVPLEDYPVSIAMNKKNPVNPICIYRLKDKLGKCYRFFFNKRINTNGNHFTTYCSGCYAVASRTKMRRGELDRMTDGLHMLSDPLVGHLPGCKPLDYKKALIETPPVKDIVAKKILKGMDISVYLPPRGSPFSVDEESEAVRSNFSSDTDHDSSSYENDEVQSSVTNATFVEEHEQEENPSAQLDVDGIMKDKASVISGDDTGPLPTECRDKKLATFLSPSAKKRRSSAMSVPSSFKPDDNVSLDESQHLDSDGNSQPSADMHQDSSFLSMDIRNDTSPVFDDDIVKNDEPAASDIVFSLPSSLSSDHTKCTTVKRIRIAPTTTFVRTFDAMAVNEADTEVDLSVLDGRRLRVVIERKVFPISESRSFLTHELTLPENVDIDSLMCSWNEGSLVVRADLKKIPIVLDS